MSKDLPEFTIEKIENFPVSSKYDVYRNAVADLKDGEAVVIKGLDQKNLWRLQSNIISVNSDIKVTSRSKKEKDDTYTLYLKKKEVSEEIE